MDPTINQINYQDCEMDDRLLEFKNNDIEGNFLEINRQNLKGTLKWMTLFMAWSLFLFNYYSFKNKQIYEPSPSYYLIHSYANLYLVFGALIFFENNGLFHRIFEKIVNLLRTLSLK